MKSTIDTRRFAQHLIKQRDEVFADSTKKKILQLVLNLIQVIITIVTMRSAFFICRI